MKFGAMLFQHRGEDLAAYAKLAEQLGFESVWMGEHLAYPPLEFRSRYPGLPDGDIPKTAMRLDVNLPDPLLVFAYLASITTTLRFMTGVYVLPLRNPFAVAKAVATLDQLSNGRFIFGLGVGWLKEEFDYVGMNWEDRALRSNEYMKLMTALWSEERPSFKGKTISAEGFLVTPKTVQQPHPPFVIGGHGDAAYKRAARLADGFYITALDMEGARQQIRRIREIERGYHRAKPLELTVGVGMINLGTPEVIVGELPINLDTVRELEDLGVVRILPGQELVHRDALGALRNFHDRVLSKL